MAQSLTQLLADVRAHIEEPITHKWTDTEVTRWINEGARDIARRAEVLQTRVDVAATIGQQEYTLPATVIRVYRVEWRPSVGGVYPLEYRDFNNMDAVWWTNQSTQGQPAIFTMWGYPPVLKLVTYPTVNVGGVFKVFYYSLPAELSIGNPAVTLDLPEGWHDLITTYCDYIARRKLNDDRWKDAKATYEQRVGEMMEVTQRWSDQAGAIQGDNGVMLPAWLWDDRY